MTEQSQPHPPTHKPAGTAPRRLAPRSIKQMVDRAGPTKNHSGAPAGRPAGDRSRTVPVRSCHNQDLAFQRAMMRAIASGRETPPMIGAYKDPRPFDAPRLFEPVPHSSGCTSPGLVCAELISNADPLVMASPATGSLPARAAEAHEK